MGKHTHQSGMTHSHGGPAQHQHGGGGGGGGAHGPGNVERRPQTTGKRGTFLESTAKYKTNLYDVAGITMTTPVISYPLKAVPGYISRLRVQITASGGAAGTATVVAVATDAPDNLVQSLTLRDASGYPVYQSDGVGARYITMFGAQSGDGSYRDTHARPSYSAPAVGAGSTGNFKITYIIPLELGSGYGCIAGANQSRIPTLTINLNPSSSVYTTAPGTLPTLEVRVDAEYYGAPLDDPSKAPPGNGSSVQWGFATAANSLTSAGNQSAIVPAPNLTGYLGTLIVLARNSLNNREDGWITGCSDIQLKVDSMLRFQETWDEAADRMAGLFEVGLAAPTGSVARPTGVLAYSFRDSVYPDGPTVLDNLALWEPTSTATLVEVASGSWGTITSGPDQLTMYTQRLYPKGEVPYGPEFE